MNKRQYEKAMKWANFLSKVKPKAFDLTIIAVGDIEALKSCQTKHKCGTSACAVGYLPVIFPNTYYYTESGDCDDNYSVNSKKHSKTLETLVQEDFGIPTDLADRIIYEYNYFDVKPNIENVVKRIRGAALLMYKGEKLSLKELRQIADDFETSVEDLLIDANF